MRSVILTRFGPPEVLQIKEAEKPLPEKNEILIRVHASSVNYGDLLARNFKNASPRDINMPLLFWFIVKLYFGFNKPKVKIPGSEFAGVIEAAGSEVKLFKAGDEVFGYLGQKMGSYSEYITLPENGVVTFKPKNITFEEAAVVPYGAIMALSLIKKANVKKGEKVIIVGASGGIGSAALQLAKHFGAEVTGVCGSERMEFVKNLGADQVIDYTKEDFTQNRETYDLIFDVLGKYSWSCCSNSLKENGRILYASFKSGQLFGFLWSALFRNKKVICALAPGSREDLLTVKELIDAGIIKSIIDISFPIEQIAEAHRYVEEGRRKGKVAVRF